MLTFARKSLLPVLILVTAAGSFAQFGALPPYTLEIEAVTDTVPGVHSFSVAQSGTRWLIVGGRTNGLHGFSSNDGFPIEYANSDVIVIDTVTWQYWTSSLNVLPYSVADPLRATNAQFFQDSAWLYITGGFGLDSSTLGNITFPTLTAIHIDNMINAVMTNGNIAPHIRQLSHNNLRVCGGEMHELNGSYYLVFGHDFSGFYTNPPTPFFTQIYTNEVRKFDINDDGVNLSVSNFTNYLDTVNYHRRDGNVFPVVNPNGSFSLGCYGGVFKYNINLPWLNPVYINGSGPVTDVQYQQVMSHYTSAGLTVFDSSTNEMYTTFFGGISLYDYDPQSNTVAIDSLVPFISDITTLTRHPNGTTEERVMPVQLPGLLGSNAEFMLNENLPRFANGVIDFRQLPNQRVLAGYLLGGIRAVNPNVTLTSANDTVYRVYLTPDLTVGDPGMIHIESLHLFPNPAADKLTAVFKLADPTETRISIYNALGQTVLDEKHLSSKDMNTLTFDISGHAPGIYFFRLSTPNDHYLLKFVKAG